MRILIVEDESRALKRLVRLTRSLLGDAIVSLDTATRLSAATEAIGKNGIDLLLLDLNLNGKDGFETLKDVLAESFQTIVVSAYSDRAVTAFEYGVLDFVPKPVEEERLKRAFDRFLDSDRAGRGAPKYLAVKSARKIELVPVGDVVSFNGANDYTEIRLRDGRTKLYEKTLDSIELLLADNFIRVHRSHIVRLDEIRALHTAIGSRYSVELVDGDVVPVGRTRVADLRRVLASDCSG